MIRITRDGRTIRTGNHYTEFRKALYAYQNNRCACGRWTYLDHPLDWDDSFHIHHLNGRGMGSSKRDDTFEACIGFCGRCHRIEHN